MILQRFLDFVLSALGWLVDLFFPRLVLMTILLCLGAGAFFLLLAWRSRSGGGAAPASPPASSPWTDAVGALRKRGRPRS